MTGRTFRLSFLLLSMALLLSACSFSSVFPPARTPAASADPVPKTVTVPGSSFVSVTGCAAWDSGTELVPLTVQGKFFYCVAQEKTGESIPETAIAEAEKKKKEIINDGRYDTFSFSLYRLRPNGSMYRFPEYVSIAPEENQDGWSDYCSVVSVDALKANEDGTFTVLEHTASSGNSMPKDRTKYQAGKNYLEYVERFYLRTLNRRGAELTCTEISEEEAEILLTGELRCSAFTVEENSVLDAQGTVLFSLTGAGVDPSSLCSDVMDCGHGIYGALLCEYDCDAREYAYQLVYIAMSEVREDEHTFLKLGYTSEKPSAGLLKAVADFNRKSDNVSLLLTPLAEDAKNRGCGALAQRISTERIDLIYTDNQTCTDLAYQNVIQDLYPFLENDSVLKRENYFPNVLAAAERNGSLCSTCAGFTLSTVIGAASRTGDRCCWTYDDLREAWGDLGIGTDAFHVYTTREDVFRSCLRMDLGSMVTYDAENGTYTVDTDRISQLLWFCGNFPSSFDRSGRTLNAEDATDLRLRSGKQLLLPVQISSFLDLKICGYAFNEEISFVGFPTVDGCGSTLTVTTVDPGMNFSMTSACEKRTEAWSFLRTFFTPAWQTGRYKDNVFFPSHIRCFEYGLKSAMSGEYAVDKNGELVYDKNNRLIHVSLGTMYLSDYTEVRYYPVSEERASSFRALVNSVTKTEYMLPDSEAIVEELCRQVLNGS